MEFVIRDCMNLKTNFSKPLGFHLNPSAVTFCVTERFGPYSYLNIWLICAHLCFIGQVHSTDVPTKVFFVG